MPIRPLGLARDFLHTGPGEAVAADANAVADRASIAQDVVQIGVRRIHDQRARRFLGGEFHFLPPQVRRKLRRPDLRLLVGRQRGKHHGLAVGPEGRLHRSSNAVWRYGAARRTDGFRRTQGMIFAGNPRSAATRIDHGRGNIRTPIARVIWRKDRTRRRATVRIYRARGVGSAVAWIVGRQDRPGGHPALGIHRPAGSFRAAIARIIRRKDRPGRQQRRRALSIERVVVIKRVKIRRTGASPVVGRVARRIRLRRRGINRSGEGSDSPAPARASLPPRRRARRHKSSECVCSSSLLYSPQAYSGRLTADGRTSRRIQDKSGQIAPDSRGCDPGHTVADKPHRTGKPFMLVFRTFVRRFVTNAGMSVAVLFW